MMTIKTRSILIDGHPAHISLEDSQWERLRAIAVSQDLTVAELVSEVDLRRPADLSAALRRYVRSHTESLAA
jgi:predicted DNA-binding ribbon-helix-helix protein